ncbi:acyl-CoA-binding domain-containing protein 2 isoform X2 [Physcomitrium patens]|uniref:ACB domain-containing protein n=1 Tax=Physcomitrium patens TaxID=3218 RepID=A0A7I4A9M8_PHYPA|nr:acyl-CoA-binding domain-containing protein 1-like isoform X2 [Physcomitrium patens]|eukprot:XP_024388619.1 acyl-CoA-binding domain-containing protein 1-like isoform X2 [Physcomitrella patens]
MAEWQEKVQSMILGFVFAFMVMKLISVISSFRSANLRVTRAADEEGLVAGLGSVDEQNAPLVGTDEEVEADGGDEKEDHVDDSSSSESGTEDDAAPTSRPREVCTTDTAAVSEAESKDEEVKPKDDEEVEEIITPGAQSLKALVADDVGAELEEENETDDWEGVESTDLERLFGAASTYADNMVAMFGVKPSTDAMLQLQALYKIATEGPCSTSQPSAFQPSARAKWNAWQQLGSMSQEEAMEKYISVLTEINPAWYESYQKTRETVKGSGEQTTTTPKGEHAD